MSVRDRWNAYKELGARYAATWQYFWAQRDQLGSRLLTEEEAEFQPAALAVQERPPSKTLRVIAGVLIVMVCSALAWSILGHMDIVVNATGKVVPSARVKTVAAIDTASVRALHVLEGQKVQAGQALVELDTAVSDAEHDKAMGDATEAVLQIARSQALIDGLKRRTGAPTLADRQALRTRFGIGVPSASWIAAQQHLQGQYLDYEAKRQRLSASIANLEEQLPLASQLAASYKALAATQDVAHNEYLIKEQARVQLIGQLQEARQQRAGLEAETLRQALEEIASARRSAQASMQDATRFGALQRMYTLKAPVDGTVQQLTAHTIGGIVPAAQPLMQIVPLGGPVEVEAFIENKDKGFVHEGQTAAVKIDTYDYTKYGTIPGRVSHVSQDAIEDEKRGLIYSVKVLLDRSELDVEGRPTRIAPGMAVNVEVKTGNRRIIEYVLSPLLRHTHEALNER